MAAREATRRFQVARKLQLAVNEISRAHPALKFEWP